ncbi:receptor-like protein kinase [Tanacetum coccineum]
MMGWSEMLPEDETFLYNSSIRYQVKSSTFQRQKPHGGALKFCHIGDDKWTTIEDNLDNSFPQSDITFYNGQVYTYNKWTSIIQACNINGKDPTILVYVATMPKDLEDQHVEDLDDQHVNPAYYIVGLDDGERKQLLVIIKQFNERGCPETYKTKSFKVLAYDLKSGDWSEVKDFGRKTLFVGFSSSFWTEDTTGVIRGNCIYYTDDEWDEYFDSKKGGGRDMGIYHLSDGSIEPHFTGESLSHFTPPIWL